MPKSVQRHSAVAIALPLVAALGLTGCGGGSGSGSGGNDDEDGGDSTRSGQFKDSNVAGLTYTIGGESSQTGADGGFEYESGDTISFSVGGVELGSATGDEIITVVQLVNNGSTSSDGVINRARFLQYLDEDQDTSTGINIPQALTDAAEDWSISSFSKTQDFEQDIGAIEADVVAEIPEAELPSASVAQSHIEDTQRCVRAGAFRGSYSGDDSGTFGLLVSADNSDVTGVVSDGDFVDTLTAEQSVALDGTGAFVSGVSSSGATFEGAYSSVNQLSGNWENDSLGLTGNFSGSRIGGAADAVYRFTGSFSGGDAGLFTFEVDSSDKVTGVAYSINADEVFDISGSVDGTTLEASYGGDLGTINGTLDKATGTNSGSWENNEDGSSGTFSGDGCKLN